MRCVICGSEAVIEGMCLKCYQKRRKLSYLDDIIELVRCPKCGYFKIGGVWKDLEFSSALFEIVQSKVRVHPQFEVEEVDIEPLTSGEVGKYIVRLIGYVEGCRAVDENVVNVRVRTITCERCSRFSGGYYEAIVQVRADDRKIEEDELKVVKEIINRILEKEKDNQKAFISKVVERKEGPDFYFGDKNIGRKVSREVARTLGGRVIESRKLHTRIDGRDIYRYTFAVRLPCYRVGDVVVEGEKLCIVAGYGKGLAVEDLSVVNLKNPKVVKRREELERGIVVNCDEFVAEVASEKGIIQAVTSKAVSIGDEVFVVEYNSKYYVVPKV